eukprot:gene9325-12563_t
MSDAVVDPLSSTENLISYEDNASLLSKFFLFYMNPVFAFGYKKSLEAHDMGGVAAQDKCSLLYDEFLRHWQAEQKLPKAKRSLWKVLWRTVGYLRLSTAVFYYAIYTALGFGPILILNALVRHFNNTERLSKSVLWVLVALMFIFPMLGSLLSAQSNIIMAHIGIQFRNVLVNMIFRKSLLLSPSTRQVTSTGQIVNMFSNDTAQLQRFILFALNCIIALPTIIVCLALIYQQVGPSTFVGVALIIFLLPLNGVIFGVLNVIRRKKVLVTDIRVKLMNEILNGIRVIKFYAWESAFSKKIIDIRLRELVLLKQLAYVVAVGFTAILMAAPILLPVLTFLTFVRLGNQLDAAIAFTTISLFNTLQLPFAFLPLGLAQYSQSLVACKRMLQFFDSEELSSYVDRTPSSDGVVICMKNASLCWVSEELTNVKEKSEADETNKKNDDKKKNNDYTAVKQDVEDPIESKQDQNIELVEIKPNVDEEIRINRSAQTLIDISFSIKNGSLVAVVGSVGSGKSSLLNALLGEMQITKGNVQLDGTVAYCDQRPWILNDTLRNNVLFGIPYDEERFDMALYAANLGDDIKVLPGGINTQIGERGINLSGGQKARVALARAIYRDADIYLLDDPLSAVDAHVGQFLFKECIQSALSGKTRLLVTHHVQYLSRCDMVIVLEDGLLKAFGTYEEILAAGIEIHASVTETNNNKEKIDNGNNSESNSDKINNNEEKKESIITDDKIDIPTVTIDKNGDKKSKLILENNEQTGEVRMDHLYDDVEQVSIQQDSPMADPQKRPSSPHMVNSTDSNTIDATDNNKSKDENESRVLAKEASKAAGEWRKTDARSSNIISKEEKQEGDVSLGIYGYYIMTGGVGKFTLMVTFLVITQGFGLIAAFWLSYWGQVSIRNDQNNHPLSSNRNIYYLNYYALFACLGLLCTIIRAIILANHRLGTSLALHNGLLKSTLSAPVAFFDVTPVGRVLNRFSSDLLVIDEELSQTISQLTNSLGAVIGALSAIAGATKGIFLILLVPIIGFYIRVQNYFRKTNTAIARIESVSRSPIYVDFSQALSGMASIRAYGAQERFISNLEKAVDINSVANVFQQIASNWLSIRLDFIGSLISFFIALIAVATPSGFIPAGFLGLGLTYSFLLTNYLKFCVRMVATLEAQMNAVERVKYYMDNIVEEGSGRELETKDIPNNWPEKGCIKFDNISMRYRDGPLVIKGLSCDILSSEKVGIAGRTGSGKSSLMIALFRIQELSSGSLFIDNIDTATIPLNLLRSKLGIIPQDPVMFSATVRFNLDPFQQYSDEEIWNVLEGINLKEHVLSLPKKLEEEVAEGGDNFSAGQRQLICIARAILRKPKILVLDEATASIDNTTDSIVQKLVRTQFKECTVLTIAHRLNTIMDSDRIMILDDGILAELDAPNKLLQSEHSHFKQLWDKHQKST